MKFRSVAALLCAVICFSAFCTAGAEAEAPKASIIATNFPAYDISRVIAGDDADVRMLLPAGSESHSYEPAPQDIVAIQSADLFVYVGGESDAWIERTLASMGDSKPEAFTLMECVTVLDEEHTESMDEHEHEGEGGAELDEHVWTSPKNVMLIAEKLADRLTEIMPGSETSIHARLEAYLGELNELDAAFREVVAGGKHNVMIFGDRFPMRYFAEEYGLEYDAAFPGCSEDSEPSVKTVMSLVERVRKEGVPIIFYIEFSNRKTADIIAEETGTKELLFHSCHNISAEELQAGESYLSLMRRNVEALREALQ